MLKLIIAVEIFIIMCLLFDDFLIIAIKYIFPIIAILIIVIIIINEIKNIVKIVLTKK